QAAGLQHPRDITAFHIVRRDAEHGVKLLANQLSFLQPGDLLTEPLAPALPSVFRLYWPKSQAASFTAVPTV
ncbi:MAG: FMN-binding glutamate synthase family protein, partial [Pseudomonadota bacterium]